MPRRRPTRARSRAAFVLVLALFAAACGVDDAGSDGSASASDSGELTPVLPAPEPEPTSENDELAAPDDETPAAEETTSVAPTTEPTTTTVAPTTTVPPREIPTVALERLDLDIELIATLSSPVGLASRPGSDDLFVVEQRGRIVRLPGGSSEGADTTLDLRGQVSLGNEQGLLGLAFDATGEHLYINYTDGDGTTTISRYDMEGTAADVGTDEILLQIPQPRGNHNGGQLAFGPDGYLYIGMGDGGGGGDPLKHGQNPNTLHGAILRIDVDTDDGYLIPPDNPFVGGDAPEVYIWGIRNAWRFDFDDASGDLWIGDVGQDRLEEITVLRADAGGGNGANLGWNLVEGDQSYRGGEFPDGHVAPVISYGHGGNRCSVTGGEVYRGQANPRLYGTYLYADYCSGEIFGYRVDDSGSATRLDVSAVDQPTSFGTDADGEMYVLSRSGGVYRISELGQPTG